MDSWSNTKGKYGTQRQGDWIFDVATGERLQYVGPKSKTTTQSNVNLSSPEEVQALVTQTLREALGRNPTAKEHARFKSTIGGNEQQHPEVTTTTTTLSNEDIARAQASGGDVWSQASQQSSQTAGGTSDAARMALVQEPTEDTPEFGKYQSGTTYFNALLALVGGS
jgi:DNA mismatch repair ATPase MutL